MEILKIKRLAFTLVEIMIVLVIIGVIAVLTLPAFMGDTTEKRMETARNKALSTVNKALLQDYALYDRHPNGDQSDLALILKNHLSIIGDDGYEFTAADGTFYDIDSGDSFLVDLNGNNKGENEEGVDVFRFCLDGRKVVYNEDNTCDGSYSNNDNGSGADMSAYPDYCGNATCSSSLLDDSDMVCTCNSCKTGYVMLSNGCVDPNLADEVKLIGDMAFGKVTYNNTIYYAAFSSSYMSWYDAMEYCPEGSSLPDKDTLEKLYTAITEGTSYAKIYDDFTWIWSSDKYGRRSGYCVYFADGSLHNTTGLDDPSGGAAVCLID